MKSIWASKMVWVSIITALVMVLTAPDILGIMPDGSVRYFAGAVAALNIILRVFFTDTKLV